MLVDVVEWSSEVLQWASLGILWQARYTAIAAAALVVAAEMDVAFVVEWSSLVLLFAPLRVH